MYITCQKCKASFVVSSEQIGAKGRRVRCSKCQHMWYVDPINLSQSNKAITPQIELLKLPSSGIHLPIVLTQEPKKPSWDWVIMTSLFLIFSFAIFSSKFIGYDSISSNNLILSDVKVNHSSDKMVLHYTITNNGDKLIAMPDIRIRLFDAEHKQIEVYDMIGGEAELEPHQQLKFRTELIEVPGQPSIADIAIGSKLSLIFDSFKIK